MMLTTKRFAVAVATLVFVSKAIALSCLECEEERCANINSLQCKGGTALDPCGCCMVCAKVEGESCGGPWNIAGVCDKGLVCSPQSDLITGRCIDPERKNTPSKLCIQKYKYVRKHCLPKSTVFCNKTCKICCSSETTCNPDWQRYLPEVQCLRQRRFYAPRSIKYNDELGYDEDDVELLDNEIKG